MARLEGVCTGHKLLAKPPNSKQASSNFPRYIAANSPSMTRLVNEAQAIFGPPGICKWEGRLSSLHSKEISFPDNNTTSISARILNTVHQYNIYFKPLVMHESLKFWSNFCRWTILFVLFVVEPFLKHAPQNTLTMVKNKKVCIEACASEGRNFPQIFGHRTYFTKFSFLLSL